MHYGPRWRVHRKLLNEFLNIDAIKRCNLNRVRGVSDMLVNLYQQSKDFREDIHL